MHGRVVERTTAGHGRVEQMSLASVRELRIRSGDYAGDFGCERVPTFVEVLRLCRGHVHVLIDVEKTNRVDLIVRAVQESGAREWVTFDARNLDKIHKALALDPQLEVMIRPASLATIVAEFRAVTRRPSLAQLEKRFL